MTKANVGHSTYDATTALVEALADLSDDQARIRFIKAGLAHAEEQADIVEQQALAIADKWNDVKNAWAGKLAESDKMVTDARNAVETLTRELEALES